MLFSVMEALLNWLKAFWVNASDVLSQKILMRGLGPLASVGGDVKDLTVVVTGPTSGIGLETAAELARRGAHVILACRSAQRGEKLKQQLLETHRKAASRAAAAAGGGTSPLSSPPPVVEVWSLDLSSLASVRAFAERWEGEQRPLHVLINNAGIYSMAAPREETVDGFEAHLAANHLGHFLLTLMLMPALRRGAELKPAFGARIVSVSSAMHYFADRGMCVVDPHLARHGKFHSQTAYAQSKLAQLLFTRELRRRLPPSIQAMAVHPGMVLTDVVRTLPGPVRVAYKIVMASLLLTPSEGARASIYCATSPTAPAEAAATGGYFNSNCRPVQPSQVTRKPEQAAWLWQWSKDQVKLPKQFDLPEP